MHSKYLHEAEREKEAPKHPRHLNTSKKTLKNISLKLRQQSQAYNSMAVSANYSKEKYLQEIENKMLT